MADAGGHEVARIAVRVVPNLRNFREAVAAGVKREMKGFKVKVPVSPDMKGFAQEVKRGAKAAAEAASGNDVEFDSKLNAAELAAKARLAALAASGQKVNFGIDIDRRGLSGLFRSVATGFRSVSVVPNKGLFSAIQRQIEHVNRGLAKLRKHMPDWQPLTKGVDLFGRSVDAASRPVIRLGNRMKTLYRTTGKGMKQLSDFGYGEWRAGLYRVVEGFADLRQAGKRFDREVIVPLQAGFQNIGEKGLNQLRKAGFGDQIEHSFLRARAEMDRLRSGTKDFVRDWSQHHSIGDRLAMGLRGAREEMTHLGRQIRDTPAGFQIEQALRRARGEASALRGQLQRVGDATRKIGESDRWKQFAKGAESAARRVRSLDFTFGSKRKTVVGAPDISRPVGAMKRFTAETNKSQGALTKLVGKIPLLGKAFGDADKKSGGFFKNFRQKYFQADQSIGYMAVAILGLLAPAIGLAGSLMAGLPTLLAGVGAAAGVVALGFQGIKDAVQPLAAALEPLKASLADTFRTNLTPAFEKLAGLMPRLQGGFTGIANGLSKMFTSAVDIVMLPENVQILNNLLDRTGQMFSAMAPGVEQLTQGFLTMFEGASQGFHLISTEFNKFATMFQQDMARLVNTGQMQAAMESLAAITGSLFTGLHKMLVTGIEQFPKMEEGVVSFFDGFTSMIVKAMPLLAEFSNFALKGLGQLGEHIGNVFQAIEPGMTRVFQALGPAISAIIAEIGPPLTRVAGKLADSFGTVAEKIGGALERLAPSIGGLVEQIGNGLVSVLDTLSQGNTIDRIADSLVKFAEAAIQVTGAGLDALIPMLPSLVDNFSSLATTLADGLIEDMIRLANDALPGAIAALELLVQVLDKLVGIGNALSNNSGISGFLKNGIFDTLMPQVSGLSGVLGSFFGKTKEDAAASSEAMSTFGTNTETMLDRVRTSASVPPDFATPLHGAVAGAQEPLWQFEENMRLSSLNAVTGFGANMATLPALASQAAFDATAAVQTGMGSLGVMVSQVAGEATSGAASALAPLPGIVSSSTADAASTVQSALAPLPGYVASAGADMSSEASTAMSNLNTEVQTGVTTASATAATLVPAVKAGIGPTQGVLVGSGQALVDGFIQGIRSRIGAVSAAAAEVAAAAKANFPNSPAKEGPLSGRGYTTYSGHALVEDFAKGMQGRRNYVQDAAGDIAGDVVKGLEEYQKSVDKFNHDQLMNPILENNAKKIADYKKREAEALKNAGKDAEKNAQQALERRNKLLESLEVPDFRDINTSFQSYYIDASKGMMEDSLKRANIAGQLRSAALDAVKQAREVFEDHPIMDEVTANVNAKHFVRTIERVIEESDIAYIPIELGIANLEQFKSDLGLGSGAISKALDAAIQFNPNNSDAYRFDKEAKEEVHYHVSDMQEAIRMEEERRRRGALRYI